MAQQRHMLLSVLFTLSFSVTCAMDKWKPSSIAHNNSITRAMDGMLGLIYRHDLTLNNDHTDVKSTLLNNSKLIRKKYGASYEDVIASKGKLNLPHAIMILVRAPYPAQSLILQHLNIDLFSNAKQEAFSTPLVHMLITRKNLELRFILPHTLRLLDETQFSCMHDVTIRRPGSHKKYLDEEKQQLAYCTPISAAQKEILSALPDQFMHDEQVQWLFDQSPCGEKPSTLTRSVAAPLGMILHASRCTIDPEETVISFLNPLRSRYSFTMLSAILALILHPDLPVTPFCLSMAFINLQSLLKPYSYNQKCIVKAPTQLMQKETLIFTASTFTNIFMHKLCALPLKNILTATAIAYAPLILYDYCTYGLLYPIKTQSLARLIEDHKKSPKRSFCTLL